MKITEARTTMVKVIGSQPSTEPLPIPNAKTMFFTPFCKREHLTAELTWGETATKPV
jgi:hypothetical protein